MANWSSTVSCAEEAGSANEAYNDEGGLMTASVQLRCAWADRHLLVADICGNRRDWIKGSAGPVPKAATASIVPVLTPGSPASSGQELIYGQALVTINYTTKFVDVVSESIEPTAEFVTLDYRKFRWGAANGDPLREEEAPGRLVRGINFVRNELNLSSVPDSVYDLVGSVNQAPVVATILGRTFAIETLLYAPPTVNYKKDSSGSTKYDVTKKFTYNPREWNKYFRAKSNTYEYIHRAGSATPHRSYPLADFSSIT